MSWIRNEPRRFRTCLFALVAWARLLAACGDGDALLSIPEFEPCLTPVPGEASIAVSEGEVVAGGAPLVPHGINSYPLLQHVGDGRIEAVRDVLGQALALGRPFVRTNAFMEGGENPARLRDADGTIREEGLAALDVLVAEAGAFGVRLLLVLANNWDDYGGAPAVIAAVAAGEGLPKDAFWSDPRAVAAQRAMLRAIASRENGVTGVRYARDPTIFAWELVNEARCEDPAYCGPTTLVQWAGSMSDELHAAGVQQPIAWGGAGYRGEHGEDLEAIARGGAVDLLTLHLYMPAPSTLASPLERRLRIDAVVSAAAMRLYDRIALARAHMLPLLLEELGYSPPLDAPQAQRDAERAEVFEAVLAVAHAEQVATLPWMIGEAGRLDYDGHLIRPEDLATARVLGCADP